MLQLLGDLPSGPRRIRALILTPTRELAAQVHESVQTYGKHRPIRSMEIYGGVSARPQIKKIQRGVDVVIATPGRLLDHVRQGNINLSGNNLLDNPAEIQVAARNTTADRVEQLVYPVDKARKRELLSEMVGRGNWQQVLVFTRTKHGANRLAKQLNQDGIVTSAIHGGKGQGARTKALSDFKANKVRVLVATDIAARGLDIQKLPHVVNYELPHVPEDYVHRIGRTARAGQEGTALSLVCVDELRLLKDIEKLLKLEIKKEYVEGYEVDRRIKAEAINKGRSQRPSGPRPGSRKKVSKANGSRRPAKNAGSNQRKRFSKSKRSNAS